MDEVIYASIDKLSDTHVLTYLCGILLIGQSLFLLPSAILEPKLSLNILFSKGPCDGRHDEETLRISNLFYKFIFTRDGNFSYIYYYYYEDGTNYNEEEKDKTTENAESWWDWVWYYYECIKE